MSKQILSEGALVRFKCRLGLVESVVSDRFEDEVVNQGEVGEYVGLHPESALADKDWHMVRVGKSGRELLCPCHESQFEAVES